MGKLVLVTGGAGFVGSHLIRSMLASGFSVRVLDAFVYGKGGLRELEGHPELELVDGDICDAERLGEAVRDTSAVIALAALVGDAACDLDPQRSTAINFESTSKTIAACEAAGVRRLVFASTCSVYGANGSQILREDSHLNPVSLYARTRLMSEDLLLQGSAGREIFVLRLATVCGTSPRMRFDLMVNSMTASAFVRRSVWVSGADQWRPHLHVQDAADAFLTAIEAPGEAAGIYNVGCDEQNFTIGQIADKVALHVPGVSVEHRPSGDDARSYRVSFERIRKNLGFQPKRTVDDAIEEVLGLLSSGEVADFTEDRFHNARWLNARPIQQGAA